MARIFVEIFAAMVFVRIVHEIQTAVSPSCLSDDYKVQKALYSLHTIMCLYIWRHIWQVGLYMTLCDCSVLPPLE